MALSRAERGLIGLCVATSGLTVALMLAMSLRPSGGWSAAFATSAPDKTVVNVARGLARAEPGTAYEALPPSMQQQVQTLARDFAERADERVWSKAASVLRKFASALRAKHAMLAEVALMREGFPESSVRQAMARRLANDLAELSQSRVAEQRAWQTGDVRGVLASSGPSALRLAMSMEVGGHDTPKGADPWEHHRAKLNKVQASQGQSSGDWSVVDINWGQGPVEHAEFVRVEGRWLPKDFPGEWAQGVAKARRWIQDLDPKVMINRRPRVMAALEHLEQTIPALESADKPDAFEKALNDLGKIVSAELIPALTTD